MGRELLGLGVWVDDPLRVADRYGRILAMRPLAVDPGIPPRSVVMCGSSEPPWVVLMPPPTESLSGIPRGRGVRMLTCATDDFERDALWLRSRGLGETSTIRLRTSARRCCTAALTPLGVGLHLVERFPAEGNVATSHDRATDLETVRAVAMGSGAATDDHAAAAALSALASSSAAAPEATCLEGAPLDHMAVSIVDEAEARDVVEQLLGCRSYEEFSLTHDTGTAHLRLFAQQPPDGFSLVLAATPDASEQHPFRRQMAERGGPGIHHVAHRIRDIEAAVAAVRAAGGTVLSKIEEAPGLLQVFVSVAEDGLVHELTQRSGVTGFVTRNTANLVSAEAAWESSTGLTKAER